MRIKAKYLDTGPSLGEMILDILWTASDITAAMGFVGPYSHIRRREKRPLKRWQYNKAVKYLARDKHLEIVEKNNKLFLKLTSKGKLRALMNKLNSRPAAVHRRDGKWRLIIWDIPETSNSQRNHLRAWVKHLGFYQLQKSVFITPYSIPKEAVDYLVESGLIDFIRFLRVDKLDKDADLRKHFNL